MTFVKVLITLLELPKKLQVNPVGVGHRPRELLSPPSPSCASQRAPDPKPVHRVQGLGFRVRV